MSTLEHIDIGLKHLGYCVLVCSAVVSELASILQNFRIFLNMQKMNEKDGVTIDICISYVFII